VIDTCVDVHGPNRGFLCTDDPIFGCQEGDRCRFTDLMPGLFLTPARLFLWRPRSLVFAVGPRCT
jgi:hypothetical protein